MTKNPPCNTGDTASVHGWGAKIPHAMEQLSLAATTTEAQALWIPQDTTQPESLYTARKDLT